MSKLKQLYREIWQERTHICAVCNYPINKPLAHVFSHVYSKGARPDLKYDKRNIQLWCSTLVRNDGKVGCHEAHHQQPMLFKERAKLTGWEKPDL